VLIVILTYSTLVCLRLDLHYGVWLLLGISEKKNTEMHVALCGNFSGLVSTTNLVKVSKDAASLVASLKKFLLGGACFLSVMS